jgi:hypothetical protein
MLNQMLKVQNANILKTLFFFTLFISCSIQKQDKNKNDKSYYKIKKYKSNTNKTSLHVNTFDKDLYDEPMIPLIIINNIYFSNTTNFNLGIGKHNLKIDFISKNSIEIKNMNIRKGDSIVINAYLKDHSILLH